MSTKMVLIGLIGLNVALLGGTAYLYSSGENDLHQTKDTKVSEMKVQVSEFGKDVDEFGMLYAMLQSQHQQNSSEIEHLLSLQDISKQVSMVTFKSSDDKKRVRLIKEMREWMQKRYSGSVYVEGKTQQLSVLLKLFENEPKSEVLSDIEKTVMNIIQTSLEQSMKQSQRFFVQTEKLKKRIAGLEKKVQSFN